MNNISASLFFAFLSLCLVLFIFLDNFKHIKKRAFYFRRLFFCWSSCLFLLFLCHIANLSKITIFRVSKCPLVSLPIYEAISFQQVMQGGRTNPWLVLVNENGQERPYVVKLFSEIENNRRGSIGNEILGNVLAQEFNLATPKAALIDVDNPDFIRTIKDENAYHIYEHADERIKFGSEYIFPHSPFIKGAVTRAQAKRAIEIDTLFAFDNLIVNRDRGQSRTNILMKDKSAILIDHELAFDIDADTLDRINSKNWVNGFQFHIFHDYLKKSTKKTKSMYFGEFEEYLKYLQINNLQPYLAQLNQYGYSTAKHENVMEYLENVRINSPNFVQLLQALIS